MEGWHIHQPWEKVNQISVNQHEARSHFWGNQYISDKMARNVNYLAFSLGDLEVQVVIPLIFGTESPHCVSSIKVFNRTLGPVDETEKKRQFESKVCPSMI